MPAGPGQSRRVVVVVEFGIGVRRAGVPDREYACLAIDRRQRPGFVEAGDRPARRRDADVAVRVDQARQHEAAGGDRRRGRDRRERNAIPDEPQIALGVIGEHNPAYV